MDLSQGNRPMAPGRGSRADRRDPSTIVVRIDQLVLEGLPAGDRWRIAAALESELTRLVAEGGLPPELLGAGAVATIETDGFAPGRTDQPEAIGAQVAQAIYAGFGQDAGPTSPARARE